MMGDSGNQCQVVGVQGNVERERKKEWVGAGQGSSTTWAGVNSRIEFVGRSWSKRKQDLDWLKFY